MDKKEYLRQYYLQNKAKIIERTKKWKKENHEKVLISQAAYRETAAKKIADYNESHAEEVNARSRQWYADNREYVSERGKKSYKKNKKEVLKRNAKWRAKNRVHVRSQQREYKRRRLASDPVFRFVENARRRILNALNGVGSKSARTIELLGCTGEYACAYLEKKFKPEMSWRNYGKWHIDHILPLASFDLSIPSQQRKAFHYTNMQPLWAGENRKKAALIEQR